MLRDTTLRRCRVSVVKLHIAAVELPRHVNAGSAALLAWSGCCLPCQPRFSMFVPVVLIISSCTCDAVLQCCLHSHEQQLHRSHAFFRTCPVTLACREEVVQVLPSNNVEQMDDNIERIALWSKQFLASR